jgi:apolipoprotein N-acyltransferase
MVSIALFVWLLRGRTSGDARVIGLVYGLTYGLGTMYWLFGIFGFLAVSFVALMAGYFGILATAIAMTKNRSWFVRAILAAVFAVAVECLRGDAWYLRFPWYTPAHALAQAPAWIALGRWSGTYGLSLVLWFIAGLGAFGQRRYWLLFFTLPAFSLFLDPARVPDRMALLMQVEESHLVEPMIADLPETKYDLAVLPEYAFPYSLPAALLSRRGPTELARKLRCPVVFGSVEGSYGQPGFQNVAAVIDPQGALLGTFPKQRPVPLMLDGRAGDRRPVFAVEQGVLGIGICYDFDAPEIAASLVRQGATVLLAPTGDLMPWGKVQHLHHELLLRLRAVENDRWVLRPTTSGRTEAIDPHGVPSSAGLGIGEVGSVAVAYANHTGISVGSRLHLLGPGAAVVAVIVVLPHLGSRLYARFLHRGARAAGLPAREPGRFVR